MLCKIDRQHCSRTLTPRRSSAESLRSQNCTLTQDLGVLLIGDRVSPAPPPCQTNFADEGDVFSFLAGAQPFQGQFVGQTIAVGTTSNPMPWSSSGCAASAPGIGDMMPAQFGHPSKEPSPQTLSPAELGMLLKSIQTFVVDFPKLEMGESGTRASKFHGWKIAVEQTINPAGPHIIQWWKWCLQEAENAHKVFLQTPLHQREAVMPTASLPAPWLQLEAWIRPKILDSLPKEIREWVNMRARQGRIDQSHVLLFYMMKAFSPGGADEKVQLTAAVLNPNVCSQPRAAQVELLKWKENLRRCAELRCHPPDLLLAYRAMESIFSAVFDKAEPLLNQRWVTLRNNLGVPHNINLHTIESVSRFAEAELGALVLHGGTGLNTGLPLTENQKARQQQIREADRKRAAALRTPPLAKTNDPPLHVVADNSQAASVRYSSTTSSWAAPCRDWAKGHCSKGIRCHFAHAGFSISESRCITCGASDHSSKDCKAPGGGADPNREAVWSEYRKRKEQAMAQGKGIEKELRKVRREKKVRVKQKLTQMLTRQELFLNKSSASRQPQQRQDSRELLWVWTAGQMFI